MGYKLFLDDIRDPSDIYTDHGDFVIARSFNQAVDIVLTRGIPIYVSFDHDLSSGPDGPFPTGMDFAKWLVEYIMDHNCDLTNFEFKVHSANPVGSENISSYLNSFLKYIKER